MIRADTTVKVDTAWEPYLARLQDVAGGLLAVGVVVAVIAVAVWSAVSMFERFSHMRGQGFNRVIGIVLGAAFLAATPAAVAWGAELIPSINMLP